MDNLISIIIPAYNIEQYLPICLDSVCAQTYENLEIIVVNDGSTDGTGVIIDAYAEKDSRIIPIHKENGGVSSARMSGIAAAKGDYIGFVDGDDYVEPEMFAHLLKNALKHNVDISHCGYQMVFPDGHVDMYYNTGHIEVMDHDAGVKALISGKYIEPGVWNKLFCRDVIIGFESATIWDASIRINEDLLMNYILFCRASSSVYEDIPFYHYRLRKGSAATSETPRRYKVTDPMRVIKAIYNDVSTDLRPVAAERYLRVLVGTAQQTAWQEEAKSARCEIKKLLPKCGGVSKKVIFMAFGAAYLQPVYKLVRKVYNRVIGIDKKYDLE